MSTKGRQYAIYMHHSFPVLSGKSYYEPAHGAYEPVITLALEKGNYTVTFIEPETLKVMKETDITSDGAMTELDCPRYSLDLAIKIIACG